MSQAEEFFGVLQFAFKYSCSDADYEHKSLSPNGSISHTPVFPTEVPAVSWDGVYMLETGNICTQIFFRVIQNLNCRGICNSVNSLRIMANSTLTLDGGKISGVYHLHLKEKFSSTYRTLDMMRN